MLKENLQSLTLKVELCKYKTGQKADFYIQSHGKHAGRPLRKPIPNCFSIWTNKQDAFEIVYCLYISKRFYFLIIGSVIPFVRLREVRILITEAFDQNYDSRKLKLVLDYDLLLTNLKRQIESLERLKYVAANSALKTS